MIMIKTCNECSQMIKLKCYGEYWWCKMYHHYTNPKHRACQDNFAK